MCYGRDRGARRSVRRDTCRGGSGVGRAGASGVEGRGSWGRGGITLIAAATGAASAPTPTRRASGSPTRRLIAFETAHLQRLKFHGNWNYTVTGTPAGNTTRSEGQEKFISEP